MRQYYLFLFTVLFPVFVWASSEIPTDFDAELAWLQEETVVISASRVAESIKKTASSVTVIDAAQIRVMGATNLWEVLRTVPGLGISQTRLAVTKIESRGVMTFFSEKVLILIDNHPIDVNFLNGGATFLFFRFPVFNVKRLEIVRGPGSALYGANAFTAVVNIITNDVDDNNGVDVAVRTGSGDLAEGELWLGKKVNDWKLGIALFKGRTSGLGVEVEQDVLGRSGKTSPWLKTSDIDVKLENKHFFLRGKYHRDDSGPFFGAAGALNDEDHHSVRYTSLQSGFRNAFTEQLTLESRLYYDQYGVDNTWELFPENTVLGPYTYSAGYVLAVTSKNTKRGLESTLTWHPATTHTIVAGIQWEVQDQSDITSKSTYNPLTNKPNDPPVLLDYSDPEHTWAPNVNRRFWAVYGEDIWDITPSLRVSTGVRYDHYSDFGGVTNPRLGFSYAIMPRYVLKGLAGRAFRAPTFSELHNINNPVLVGNPNLTPEVVRTYELGLYLDYEDKGWIGQINLFRNEVDDLIAATGSTYANQKNIETQGVEMSLRYNLRRGAFWEANYTYVRAQDIEQQSDLPNIAQHRANFLFNWRASSNVNVFFDTFWKSSTPRPTGDSRDALSAYGVVNSTVVVSNFTGWARGLELRFRVNNLFDRSYADPTDIGFSTSDYQHPARNIWLEGRYAF